MYRKRLWSGLLTLVVTLVFGTVTVGPARVTLATAPAQSASATYPFLESQAIERAVGYLRTQQVSSGGINSFGAGADPGGTSRLLMALNAVGYPANALVSNDNRTLADYLAAEVVGYIYKDDTPATDNLFPGRAGLVLGAVSAARLDPRNKFGGVNLIAELEGVYRADGTYSTNAVEGFASGQASEINQTLAILGLVSAGRPIPPAATQWLIGRQRENGSWINSIDVTGYGLLALIGSGNVPPTDPAVQRALAFLRASQTGRTALWGDTGGDEPANSSGWAMTALSAYGYVPMTRSWGTGGTHPRQALLGLQNDEGVIALRFFNAYATLEGLYGLTDQPLFLGRPLRVERGLAYLREAQNPDGGWPAFGSASAPDATLDTLFAFVAAGYNPNQLRSSTNNSPLDYLAATAPTYTRDDSQRIFPAQTGKLIVGVVAAGGNPASFAGFNLVSDLQSTLQANGSYSTDAQRGFTSGAASVTNQSFAILGLVAAGEPIPAQAITFLNSLQTASGSWGIVDETGLALQALIAAGVAPDSPAVVNGINFLRSSQAASGGWEAFGAVNSNSTAYAIQGLLAAGVDLTRPEWHKQGRWPLGALASFQKPNGPFVYHWGSASGGFNPAANNLLATQQSIPALLGAFYPYRTSGTLASSFTPINRGPNPDRLITAPIIIEINPQRTQATVIAPFGSDLNANGSATIEWDVLRNSADAAAFQSVPVTREPGAFRATINLSGASVRPLDTLRVRATFSDPDGVQDGGTLATSPVAVIGDLAPQRRYLPIVGR